MKNKINADKSKPELSHKSMKECDVPKTNDRSKTKEKSKKRCAVAFGRRLRIRLGRLTDGRVVDAVVANYR